MASAANLMGLVNQLQNMEQSLSNILIEHCLKLASLTGAMIHWAGWRCYSTCEEEEEEEED